MKIMNQMRALSILIIFVLNCSFAQKPLLVQGEKIPNWVNNPHDEYPESQYIVGVGSGDTRAAAEKDAVGSIARVFQSKVTVDNTLIENYLENEQELTFTSRILNRTRVGSNQELKNIRIDKAYFSESEGIYYVLAYMNRAEAKKLYDTDIENNNEKIAAYFKNYKQSDNKLNKFAYLSKSQTIAGVNEILKKQYQIIAGREKEDPEAIPKSTLDKEMRRLLDQISVELQPVGDRSEKIESYLKETIGSIGFKLKNKGSDFLIKYDLNITPTQLNRENVSGFNWQLSINVEDQINNYALKTFNVKNRTVSISEAEAKAKIFRQIHSDLVKNFRKEFLNYVNSL